MNKQRNAMRGKQGRKDSKTNRVNFDNTRKSKFEKDVEEMEKASYPKGAERHPGRCNDIIWYANNPELLRSAASIPFSWTTGAPLPFDMHGYGVPGVMELDWAPYIGSYDGPVVTAANEILSYVVHANSRNLGYDANDIMILILAGAQVFSAFAVGVRAYGVLRRYDQRDAYTPDALLRAMGFQPDDLRTNAAQMWFDLNQLAAQLQQIWIPNTMPLIERWFWLNSQIFRDGDSIKSQYYMFTPSIFYQYSETASETGGSLVPINWALRQAKDTGEDVDILHTWDEYVKILQDMINALINSQDRGVIFGDILKAYGADKLYSVSPIAVDYTIEPVFDKEVLSQIENATFFNNTIATPTVRVLDMGPIVQLAGKTGLVHRFMQASYAPNNEVPATTNMGAPFDLPLNFHQRELPTPEQVMIATRLRSQGMRLLDYGKSTDIGKCWIGPAVAGTEVLTGCRVYITQNSVNNVITYPHMLNKYTNTDSWGAQALNVALAFDWSPMLIAGNGTALPVPANKPDVNKMSPVYNVAREVFMDYDNYTVLNANTLAKMHLTATYSLFGVPFAL